MFTKVYASGSEIYNCSKKHQPYVLKARCRFRDRYWLQPWHAGHLIIIIIIPEK